MVRGGGLGRRLKDFGNANYIIQCLQRLNAMSEEEAYNRALELVGQKLIEIGEESFKEHFWETYTGDTGRCGQCGTCMFKTLFTFRGSTMLKLYNYMQVVALPFCSWRAHNEQRGRGIKR